MPAIQITVDPEFDEELDRSLMVYAKKILLSQKLSAEPGLVKFKQSAKRSRFVYKYDLDGVVYYLKLYDTHHRLKGLQDFFRGRRAQRAMKISLELISKGFSVAMPVAAIELSAFDFQKRSIFITRELSGEPFKHVFIQEDNEERLEIVLGYLVELYQSLIDNQIYHYDLNLTNCWLDGDQVLLLDVDDIRQFRRIGLIRLFWNIEKHNRILMRNSIRFPQFWLNNERRKNIINKVSARYVKPIFLKTFVKLVEQVSHRRLRKWSVARERKNISV